jgi:hypothetical protein
MDNLAYIPAGSITGYPSDRVSIPDDVRPSRGGMHIAASTLVGQAYVDIVLADPATVLSPILISEVRVTGVPAYIVHYKLDDQSTVFVPYSENGVPKVGIVRIVFQKKQNGPGSFFTRASV